MQEPTVPSLAHGTISIAAWSLTRTPTMLLYILGGTCVKSLEHFLVYICERAELFEYFLGLPGTKYYCSFLIELHNIREDSNIVCMIHMI